MNTANTNSTLATAITKSRLGLETAISKLDPPDSVHCPVRCIPRMHEPLAKGLRECNVDLMHSGKFLVQERRKALKQLLNCEAAMYERELRQLSGTSMYTEPE